VLVVGPDWPPINNKIRLAAGHKPLTSVEGPGRLCCAAQATTERSIRANAYAGLVVNDLEWSYYGKLAHRYPTA
jgi:hypothetical protein